MKIFKKYGENFNYTEIIQSDGAFSAIHINYGKLPIFNNISSKNFVQKSRKNSIFGKEKIEEVLEYIYSFDGTEFIKMIKDITDSKINAIIVKDLSRF